MQSGGQNVKQVFHRNLPRWIQSPINLQSLLPLSLSQQVEVLHRALHVLVVRGSAPLHLIKLNPCGPVWFLRVRNEHLSSANLRDLVKVCDIGQRILDRDYVRDCYDFLEQIEREPGGVESVKPPAVGQEHDDSEVCGVTDLLCEPEDFQLRFRIEHRGIGEQDGVASRLLSVSHHLQRILKRIKGSVERQANLPSSCVHRKLDEFFHLLLGGPALARQEGGEEALLGAPLAIKPYRTPVWSLRVGGEVRNRHV